MPVENPDAQEHRHEDPQPRMRCRSCPAALRRGGLRCGFGRAVREEQAAPDDDQEGGDDQSRSGRDDRRRGHDEHRSDHENRFFDE
ncbi:hypothetical protein TPA0908_32970 [Micromonospora sp. AKA38]|nr:hypothetical protein TPA0908_32970 [Micromonospora sp. AKA38]